MKSNLQGQLQVTNNANNEAKDLDLMKFKTYKEEINKKDTDVN